MNETTQSALEQQTRTSYRTPFSKNIEGLRALAVILVLAHHAHYKWMSGGFIGVDVFFVISGFLIAGLLFAEFQSNGGKIKFFEFWARRAKRLLPQVLLVSLVAIGVAFYLTPLEFFQSTVIDGISSLGYVGNYRFSFSAQNYFFLNAPPSPFLHFWSLGVEEQFYILFPCALGLFYFLKLHIKYFLYALAVVSVVSFSAAIFVGTTNQSATFFQTEYRLWELGAGVILAGVMPHIRRKYSSGFVLKLCTYTGLFIIALSAFVFNEHWAFPGPWAALPVVGTILVLVGATKEGQISILSNPLSQWMGKLSYAIYLWHWPVFIFGFGLLQNTPFAREICIVLTLAISALTYYCVENPVRKSTGLRQKPGRVLIASFGAISVSALILFSSNNWPQNRRVVSEETLISMQAVQKDLPQNYADNCHLDGQSEVPDNCIYGQKDAKHKIWLFGDSHAAQWLPAFQGAVNLLTTNPDDTWSVKSVTKSSCPSVDIPIWHIGVKSYYASCDEWRDEVIRKITLMPKASRPMVVLTNETDYTDWVWHAQEQRFLNSEETDAAYKKGLKGTIKKLKTLDVKVLVIGDTPKAFKGYWDCLLTGSVICNRDKNSAVAHMVWQEPFAAINDVMYYDANDHLCFYGTCPLTINGKLIYRDDSHFSAEIIATFSEDIRDALLRLDK